MGRFNWCAVSLLGTAVMAVSAPLDAQTAYVPINRRGAPVYDASNSPRECVGRTLASAKTSAAQVFEATVTSVKPFEHPTFVATLEVHRVWKGDTSSTTTAYFQQSTAGPHLEDGKRYIFFAEPLTPAQRKDFGLAADHQEPASWVPSCTGPWLPDESTVKELGQFRKPK